VLEPNGLTIKIAKAIAEWELIKSSALRGKMNDPFILTTEKTLDLTLLKEVAKKWRERADFRHKRGDYLLPKFDNDIKSLGKLSEPRDKGKARFEMFGGSRTVMNYNKAFEAFVKRVGMAGVGGTFLIGPMLLMVLHKSLLTSLLTASICVFAFGLVLATFLDRPFEVLSGTAAYAAVLVVFVGTSSTSSR